MPPKTKASGRVNISTPHQQACGLVISNIINTNTTSSNRTNPNNVIICNSNALVPSKPPAISVKKVVSDSVISGTIESFCKSLVSDVIVKNACDIIINRFFDYEAPQYTADSIWDSLMSMIKSIVVNVTTTSPSSLPAPSSSLPFLSSANSEEMTGKNEKQHHQQRNTVNKGVNFINMFSHFNISNLNDNHEGVKGKGGTDSDNGIFSVVLKGEDLLSQANMQIYNERDLIGRLDGGIKHKNFYSRQNNNATGSVNKSISDISSQTNRIEIDEFSVKMVPKLTINSNNNLPLQTSLIPTLSISPSREKSPGNAASLCSTFTSAANKHNKTGKGRLTREKQARANEKRVKSPPSIPVKEQSSGVSPAADSLIGGSIHGDMGQISEKKKTNTTGVVSRGAPSFVGIDKAVTGGGRESRKASTISPSPPLIRSFSRSQVPEYLSEGNKTLAGNDNTDEEKALKVEQQRIGDELILRRKLIKDRNLKITQSINQQMKEILPEGGSNEVANGNLTNTSLSINNAVSAAGINAKSANNAPKDAPILIIDGVNTGSIIKVLNFVPPLITPRESKTPLATVTSNNLYPNPDGKKKGLTCDSTDPKTPNNSQRRPQKSDKDLTSSTPSTVGNKKRLTNIDEKINLNKGKSAVTSRNVDLSPCYYIAGGEAYSPLLEVNKPPQASANALLPSQKYDKSEDIDSNRRLQTPSNSSFRERKKRRQYDLTLFIKPETSTKMDISISNTAKGVTYRNLTPSPSKNFGIINKKNRSPLKRGSLGSVGINSTPVET